MAKQQDLSGRVAKALFTRLTRQFRSLADRTPHFMKSSHTIREPSGPSEATNSGYVGITNDREMNMLVVGKTGVEYDTGISSERIIIIGALEGWVRVSPGPFSNWIVVVWRTREIIHV
jgi:hypothetical protein